MTHTGIPYQPVVDSFPVGKKISMLAAVVLFGVLLDGSTTHEEDTVDEGLCLLESRSFRNLKTHFVNTSSTKGYVSPKTSMSTSIVIFFFKTAGKGLLGLVAARLDSRCSVEGVWSRPRELPLPGSGQLRPEVFRVSGFFGSLTFFVTRPPLANCLALVIWGSRGLPLLSTVVSSFRFFCATAVLDEVHSSVSGYGCMITWRGESWNDLN